MATKQIIRIEVTTSNWKTIRLSALIAWVTAIADMNITRLEIKELKK